MANSNEVLLEVKNLKKYFTSSRKDARNKRYIKAVDDVDIIVNKGETLGIVGESGCGKSTLGKTIIRLYNPTEGEIIYNNENITKTKQKDLMNFKKNVQMIFQDPYSSLNPRMSVGEIIGEPMMVHGIADGVEKVKSVEELLDKVGLRKEFKNRYPHEFSGGQRQRIGIARALALEPELIICDEPISALDVSIQAQVINLFAKLQNELGLTYLFISHDLAMVQNISDRIGVMYLGKMVEITEADELFMNPLHPYTKALLSAVPVVDFSKDKPERLRLEGEVPSPLNVPSGCRFRTRCKHATKICAEVEPELVETKPGHRVACHMLNKNHN